jgi:2-C-methyl-D-erythritol 4-phosphate cytidylyltransferase / 2-C-methyl-D-erythritol 2,4-cyclodiphosphate synthase
MQTAALIVAAGRGQRLGGETPKQYLPLGSRAVLRHALDALLGHPAVDAALVVIHPDDRPLHDAALDGLGRDRLLPPVAGGAVRGASVRAGLEALAPHGPERVLIHDAARPFLSGRVISDVLDALDTAPAACPALPVVDALWRGEDGLATEAVDRSGLWRAQTPQGFHFAPILAAHRAHAGDAPDDVSVARAAGLPVRLTPGDERNFKITTAADLDRARRFSEGAMDIRTGNGFDVHAFGPGKSVTLCGVAIPFEQGLKGHSDADVAMHAITDAIFGALAEGDIGQWFPPSDPEWKGAASEIFLRKAVERAAAGGFAITHLDCTIICEWPKIGPHAAAMRGSLAAITGIASDRISVKATTSERLGFTGRGEGIAALATATLVRP